MGTIELVISGTLPPEKIDTEGLFPVTGIPKSIKPMAGFPAGKIRFRFRSGKAAIGAGTKRHHAGILDKRAGRNMDSVGRDSAQ